METAPDGVTVVSDCLGVVQQAESLLKGARLAPRKHHADLWKRFLAATGPKAARGETVVVRWAPAQLPAEDAGGPSISLEDWWGNNEADHWTKESPQLHPDQRARASRIDEFDVLALGVLRTGIAVYSLVIQDRNERGAIPP